MPLGGSSILWDEASPPGSEAVGLGNERIQSVKTSARAGLDSEHVWPSSGGTAGAHRPGSAVAFFGTQSRVSSSDTDGRMMIASDTSKLFGAGSSGTVLLGAGPLAPSFGSFLPITMPQRTHIAMEVGRTASGISVQVAFASAFSATPFIMAQSSAISDTVTQAVHIFAASASGFSAGVFETSTGNQRNTLFDWLAIGYRAL